jgi:hypothetical protein
MVINRLICVVQNGLLQTGHDYYIMPIFPMKWWVSYELPFKSNR